jgi:hypothetical protein
VQSPGADILGALVDQRREVGNPLYRLVGEDQLDSSRSATALLLR